MCGANRNREKRTDKRRLNLSEITPLYVEKLSNLEGKKWQRTVNLINEGFVSDICLEKFAQIPDDKVYDAANNLIKKGFNDYQTILAVNNQDIPFSQTYESYINLYNKGYDVGLIPELYGLNEKQLNNVDKITNLLKAKPDFTPDNLYGVQLFADADDKVLARTKEITDLNIKNLYAIYDIATSNDTLYKKEIALLKKGYKPELLNKIAELKGSRAEKAEKLIKNYGMINFHALMYSEAYDDKFCRIKEIKDIDKYEDINNCDFEGILKLDDENYIELKKLIEEGYKYNIYFHTNDLNESIKKYGKESRENAHIWNNFINNSKNGEKYKQELDNRDIFFLKHNAFDNKYHSVEEYIDAFLYLKNLKTDKGQNILSCEEFYEKTPDDKKLQGLKENLFYNNIKQILDLNPSSEEASYIQTCLELIKEGSIHPASIRKLSADNSLRLTEAGIKNHKNYDVTISDEMKSDIDILYKTIENNPGKSKEEIDNILKKNYVKTYDSEAAAMQNANTGEVFVVNGEKFVRIKNSENEQIPLKITKETYSKLFPPYDRFATSQQKLGNCYCIETLMNIYSDKDTRSYLLKCFEEDENGNTSVKIGDYPPVSFENGEFPKTENEEIYSSGAKGFRLLEYAYSEALVYDEINKASDKLDDNEKREFLNFIKEHPHDFFIDNSKEKPEIMPFSSAANSGLYKKSGGIYKPGSENYGSFNSVLLGNGGLEYKVLKKFGLNSVLYHTGSDRNLAIYSAKTLENNARKKIKDIKNLHKKVDVDGFLKTPGFFEQNKVFVGIGEHSYALKKKDDNFYIYNPHNPGFPVKTGSLNELRNADRLNQITVVPKTEFKI